MIAAYFPDNDETHRMVIASFIRRVQCLLCNLDTDTDRVDDLAIVFGVEKYAVEYSKKRGEVIRRHKEAGKPVIVLERGYVKRDIYWSAGYGGINGRADFCNEDMPGDRWKALGVELEPDRLGKGDYILLAGQVPWDASVQDTDHVAWLSQTAKAFSDMGFPVRFRPHPKGPQDLSIFGTEASTGTLEEDLDGAMAVVTFNSNVGVDAVIRGIPTFSFDKGSMVYDVSFNKTTDINRIESKTFDRQRWANNLAYTQWTLDEMKEGFAWRHLTRESSSVLTL